MSKTMLLNANWRFHLGDDPAADFMGYDDRCLAFGHAAPRLVSGASL